LKINPSPEFSGEGRFSTAASLSRSLRLRYPRVAVALAEEQASAARGQ